MMDDRCSSASVLDYSFLNPKSDSKKRSSMELEGKPELIRKRVKMRDLESVFQSEGIKNHYLESSVIKEAINQFHPDVKEEASQITDEPVTMILDAAQEVRKLGNSLSIFSNSDYLRSGRVDSAPKPVDLHTETQIAYNLARGADDIGKKSLCQKYDKDSDLNFGTSPATGLDPNAGANSSSVDRVEFYPYKTDCHLISIDSLECGSSTDPLEKYNSLRVWKEMKLNGFLSSSYGGIPMPKQHGRKSKYDFLKKKMELAKREQLNRFTKIAAPSGLLNELNPGIINHVRNRKQVHSIIKALVRSEKLENSHSQNKQSNELKRGVKGISDRKKEMENMNNSGSSRFTPKKGKPENALFGIKERRGWGEASNASHLISDREDDKLTLKVLSSIAMVSENTSSTSNDESAYQLSFLSISIKAATVSSQWLGLLCQDIRGRLSALQRSKKRVRAVIQTELPFLLLKEFSSNQENHPNAMQSSSVGYPNRATPDMHRARWTTLFDQMDKALSEEGKKLERWLNQVKEMQLHCEQGLQCMNWNAAHGLQQLSISETDSRSKRVDDLEKELATRAAAASIYSTCNFAMSTENVLCF